MFVQRVDNIGDVRVEPQRFVAPAKSQIEGEGGVAGTAVAESSEKCFRYVSGLDKRRAGGDEVGVGYDNPREELLPVRGLHPPDPAIFDEDLFDRAIQPDRPPQLDDPFEEHVGNPLRALRRIGYSGAEEHIEDDTVYKKRELSRRGQKAIESQLGEEHARHGILEVARQQKVQVGG